MPEDRRLAAIMFTDIVGYTALMGSDEDQAFKILAINREIHNTVISRHKGTLIKEMGDGILASFSSNSDAVRCAIEIQQEVKAENIKLRIGIHEGEMVFAGADVLGDGVNVASRLEEMAAEGCINVSGAVYKDIKNKADISAEFIEEKTLKNVEEPVKIYKVHFEEQEKPAESDQPQATRKNKIPYYIIAGLVVVISAILIWQFLPTKKDDSSPIVDDTVEKSIAILPFRNDSPDPENEYFCSGMEEEIRIHLQQIEDLRVKSRTAVEKYREKTPDIKTIEENLDVAYFLEGSVNKVGDIISIKVQLIDVKSGDHLWANSYNEKYTNDLFEFQSNTVKKVAASLQAVITPEEKSKIEKIPTSEITAYDFFIRARNEEQKYWINRDTKHLRLAQKLIDKALEIDPQYLRAIFEIGMIYLAERNLDSVYIYANRIVEIDSESSMGYYLKGEYHRFNREYEAAIGNFQLTLKYYKQSDLVYLKNWTEYLIGTIQFLYFSDYLSGLPYLQEGFDIEADNLSSQYGYLSYFFRFIGDYKRAEIYNNEMIELEPELIWWYIRAYTEILFLQGKFKQSINFLDSICSINLSEVICNRYLFQANVFLEDYSRAAQYYDQLLEVHGNPWIEDSIMFAYTIKKLGKEQESFALLNQIRTSLENRLQKSRNFRALMNLSHVHAVFEDKEETFRCLSEAVDLGQGSTRFNILAYNPIFEDLWDDPEFKAIIKRNNEKLEKVQAHINEMRERGEISF